MWSKGCGKAPRVLGLKLMKRVGRGAGKDAGKGAEALSSTWNWILGCTRGAPAEAGGQLLPSAGGCCAGSRAAAN